MAGLRFVVHPNIPQVLTSWLWKFYRPWWKGRRCARRTSRRPWAASNRQQPWQNRCSSHFGHGRWPPPRWGNPPRWSGCWRSCCGSSSTRLSSSTPPTCRSPPGGVAATLAPRTTDWHLWEVGAPTRWNRTRRRCTGSMSRSMWRSTLGLSRMGIPKRRIAALEMLSTLFLCNMILTHQGPLSSRVRLPVGSDNQGNVMAMLNLGSKKPYTAAILMELVFLLHTHGCSLAANHVPREFNQWADELTRPDFSGFDPLQRVPKQELCEEFVFLPRLLNGDAFDLSVDPPMLP